MQNVPNADAIGHANGGPRRIHRRAHTALFAMRLLDARPAFPGNRSRRARGYQR